ncbi:coiled-coil domain-containing protein 148 isoform X2 [Strongylocentrotus purpuratus]|uniref:Coiled-coil domain-containing protein 148 n=1 Tax=Strongylocentrotus purpuratus TaxID=7668 RepID=A0A7M7P6V9_STRPU|nr:coiled-coil domain-containing protein 148 isoform X1 [Strongylocentrotus purpuratus]XP_030845998.1 coiled-coil domain-containing protein 148 isoform X1 [Strongylocentrotus purpuratus]XP_030845999.1 coiled-coil domain-containing protein 148 isoform X2 [Strongylocentrotus purpuratus]
MTGRDYRGFLTTHRTGARETGRPDEADKLLIRMKAGLGSTRYTKQDYDQLKAAALERKISGNRSLLKMNKLKSFSKASKENTLLKQHSTVWQRELGRLDGIRHRLEREQERLILQGTSEGSSITMFMLEAEDYNMQLQEELEKFRKATAEPVWSLKDDLKIWLSRNRVKLQRGGDDELDDEHAEVCDVIESVKSQQEAVMKQLEHEQWALESELDSGFLQGLSLGTEKCVMEGIPMEAEVLECPDLEIRDAVLQEFLTLDEKYKERLSDLDKRHSSTLVDSFGGWSRDDHLFFESIVEMYPRDMQNRRTLYIDRLRKQFPRRTRAQLVEHEDWMITHRYHTRLRNTLVNCWAKDKQELYEKAAAIFADVCLAAELESIAAINEQRQETINYQLRAKIELWREQKLEAMRIEEELEAQRLENVQKEMEWEKQKEEKKRTAEKQKIQVYKEQVQKEQEKEEAKKRERLAELRKEMEVQAEHDKERVVYRQYLQELKEERMREEQMRLQEEELERERRLEALREQVAVHVESDPFRVMQATMASKAHLGIGVEQDVNIQQPLFEMKTFSSDKVMSDPRLILEQALRKAGLHENPYARHMIGATKPLKAPRPDMKSSLFKDK